MLIGFVDKRKFARFVENQGIWQTVVLQGVQYAMKATEQ